jgi:hypothetical protein
MMLTRVVDSARVSAAVKRAHINALNTRLRPKKTPRTRMSTVVLAGERPRKAATEAEREEVSEVVVLWIRELGFVSYRLLACLIDRSIT